MQTVKAKGQSVQKIESIQTETQTDGSTDCITFPANAVSEQTKTVNPSDETGKMS